MSSTPKILLVSAKPADRAFVAGVATEGGFELHETADFAKAAELVRDEELHAVLVRADAPGEYAKFEAAITEFVGLFSDRVNSNRFHFLADSTPGELGPIFAGPLLGHLVRVPGEGDPLSEGAARRYARILAVGAATAPRIFGPEAIIGAAHAQVIKLANSRQRPEAVDAVRNYLEAAKFQVRMAALIANAVDELLMNAIFDAPVDAMGRSMHARTARTADFALEGKHQVEMRVAFHDNCAAISVIDGFGSVDRGSMLGTVAKDYRAQNYKVRSTIENAGLGLASILHAGGSLVISCERQSRTESTIVFQRTVDFKEFRKQFQSFSAVFFD